MTYQKINSLTELRKLANGRPAKAPTDLMAGCAIPLIQAGLRDRDAKGLERLFPLPDTRNA